MSNSDHKKTLRTIAAAMRENPERRRELRTVRRLERLHARVARLQELIEGRPNLSDDYQAEIAKRRREIAHLDDVLKQQAAPAP